MIKDIDEIRTNSWECLFRDKEKDIAVWCFKADKPFTQLCSIDVHKSSTLSHKVVCLRHLGYSETRDIIKLFRFFVDDYD